MCEIHGASTGHQFAGGISEAPTHFGRRWIDAHTCSEYANTHRQRHTNENMLRAGIFMAVAIAGAHASNGDNHFCKGCTVTMEHAWHEIDELLADFQTHVTAGVQQNVTIDIDGRVAKHLCDRPYWKDYTQEIKDGCAQIIDKNSFIIREAFHGDKATPSMMYDKIRFACVERQDLCDPLTPELARERYGAKRMGACDECLTVVRGVHDVLLRKKGSPGYLSRKHVWAALEDACTLVLAHHPPPHAARLQERCEQLMEEYDEDMADAFANYDFEDATAPARAICGRAAAGLCKNRQGDWAGVMSPWASSPSYDKDEL